MRIDWGKVPYYVRVIKPVFGNLGKVVDTFSTQQGPLYKLQSLVDKTLTFNFYRSELLNGGE